MCSIDRDATPDLEVGDLLGDADADADLGRADADLDPDSDLEPSCTTVESGVFACTGVSGFAWESGDAFDNSYDGSIASMACLNIETDASSATNVVDVDLTVAITHTWIGDLVIKLVPPGGGGRGHRAPLSGLRPHRRRRARAGRGRLV